MAVIQKTLFAKNLEKFAVLVNDTQADSKYFKITELPNTFTGGKNAFLIAGSEYLVPDTKIQIELKDSAGNIIYHEPGEGMINTNISGSTNTSIITEYYEGVSKVVAVYVYPDTAYGVCTLTILGELSEYQDSNGVTLPVPLNWENKYNVKWQKQIDVNPSLANTTKIRFYKRPEVTVSELLDPVYRIDTVTGVKVNTGINQSFANIKISNLETFAGDVKRVKVFRTSLGDISDYDLIQDILVESKELLTTFGLSGSVIGNTGTFTSETLKNYWITGSLTAYQTSNRVESGVALNGSGYFRHSASLDIRNTNTYELNLDAFYSSSTNSNLGIYLSQVTTSIVNGVPTSTTISSSIATLIGTQPTKNLLDTVIPFKIDRNYPSASLYFSQSQGEWHLGNISLRLSQDTAFSPDEISFITTMPTVVGNEDFNFKFEFYDVNNNYVPVLVTGSANFTGGSNTIAKLLTFESDRTAFRFSTGSFANPPIQFVKFKTTKTNFTGSITYASSAFDIGGTYIQPISYAGTYPGWFTSQNDNGALLSIASFSGSVSSVLVGSIVYTASCEGFEEYETIYRFEDGDNAPGVFVTANTNQFIYKATDLSLNPSGQVITIEAKRKNLASSIIPLTINSGSGKPPLTIVGTPNPTNGVDTYTLSGTSYPYSTGETIYSISGSDQFGNVFSDAIKISPVKILDGFSVAVSNENTSFPALSIGTVVGGFAASSGFITVKVGNEPINYSPTFVTNSFSASISAFSGLTPNTFNGTSYSINDLSADSGSLTLLVKYKDGGGTIISSSKDITYSKAKKAVPNILVSATPQSQTVVANSTGLQTGTLSNVTISALEGTTNRFTSMVIASTTGFSTPPNVSSNILTMTSAIMNSTEASVTLTITHTDSEGTTGQTQTIIIRCTKVSVGQDGNNGSDGTNAKTVAISADSYVVTYDGNGSLSPGSQTIILTASAQNFTNPFYQFTKNGTEVRAYSTTATYTITTLPTAANSDLYQVNVKEGNVGSVAAFDNTDIFGVKAGTDSYTIFLTNEAHTLPAATDGTVSSFVGSGTSIIVYKGATELNGITTGTPTTGQFKVTATVTTGTVTIGSQTSTGNPVVFADHSVMTTDLATITYSINVENLITVVKLQSLSKSKKGDTGNDGVDGNDGATGADGRRTATGMVFYQPSATSAPTKPTATVYTFSTNTFSTPTLASETWGVGAPTYTAGNSNKYWYSTYTVVESSAGSGTGTPTFSTPVQAINFTGLVTFTSANNLTDGVLTSEIIPKGSIANHIGGANVTTIEGGKISTGIITSTGYLLPAGQSLATGTYTSAGTIFNLDNGSLRSKNFYINSSGDAFFKGTLTIGGTDLTAENTLNTQANIEAGLGYTPTTATAAATAANSAAKNAGSVGGWTIASNAIFSGTNQQTDGYQASGVTFASNGAIHSKNFFVNSDGTAAFKGTLTIGGTDLNATNTLNENTTKSQVGLGSVENLSAQNQAQTGLIAGTTITGGGITLSGGGNIKGGQTAYNTGTGFFLGYSGTDYKFSIGNASTKGITWDGNALSIGGDVSIGANLASALSTTTALTTGLGTKISTGGAAGDVNSGVTKISGGQIVADSISANQISSLSFSGKTATFNQGTIGGWTINGTSGLTKVTGVYTLNLAANSQRISISQQSTIDSIDRVRIDASTDIPLISVSDTGSLNWASYGGALLAQRADNQSPQTAYGDTGYQLPQGGSSDYSTGYFGIIGLQYGEEEIFVEPETFPTIVSTIQGMVGYAAEDNIYGYCKWYLRVRKFPSSTDAINETNADNTFGINGINEQQIAYREYQKWAYPYPGTKEDIDVQEVYGATIPVLGGGGINQPDTAIWYRVEILQSWYLEANGDGNGDTSISAHRNYPDIFVKFGRVNNGYSIFAPGGLQVYQGNRNYLNASTPSGSTGDASNFFLVKGKSQIIGALNVSSGITGAFKQFKIQHPVNKNKWLYHTSTEAPRADLIYRGTLELQSGAGSASIDSASNMIIGTFDALTKNPQLFLQNNQSFDRIKGYVQSGNVYVLSENQNSTASIDWSVMAERKDTEMLKSPLYDRSGNYKTENYKSEYLNLIRSERLLNISSSI